MRCRHVVKKYCRPQSAYTDRTAFSAMNVSSRHIPHAYANLIPVTRSTAKKITCSFLAISVHIHWRIYHWATWAMAPPLGRRPKMLQIKNLTHCRHRSQGGKTEEAKRQSLICP